MFHTADPEEIKEGKLTKSVADENRYPCGGPFKELLTSLAQSRKVLLDLPKLQAIREYVFEQLPHFDP